MPGDPMSDDGSARGFTLLELIISITLLATIVLIVAGAMRLSYRSVTGGGKKVESLERFRASLFIMNAQINSSMPLRFEQEGIKRPYFQGSDNRLRLATNYSIWGGKRGHVIVEYRVESAQDGTWDLYAREAMVGVGKQREAKLLPGLSRVSFGYYYKDIKGEGTWVDTWTDEAKFPLKVRLSLVQGKREISMIVPLRAQEGK